MWLGSDPGAGLVRSDCPQRRTAAGGPWIPFQGECVQMSSKRRSVLKRAIPSGIAATAAVALVVATGAGSSHREAPNISLDPTGDNTDVYAFTAKDAPGFAHGRRQLDPARGSRRRAELLPVRRKARYYVQIDNTGDGKPDVSYRWQFKTTTRNPNSFLYAVPGVSSFNDPKLNVVQTYSLYRETPGNRGSVNERADRQQRAGGAQQRRAQDDPELRRGRLVGDPRALGRRQGRSPARSTTRSSSTSARRSTGSTSASGTGNAGGGKDDVAGYNTHSVVLQVPEAEVTRNGKARRPARPRATRSSACGRPRSGASSR